MIAEEQIKEFDESLEIGSFGRAENIRECLEEYEQSKWIKFDKNDKSTWPATLEMVNIYRKDDGHVTSAFFDSSAALPHFKCHSGYEGEIYWQPLPEPPTN